ncbi:hypothetical protein FHX82_006603 [Amycolatopsis bartoniae]|uniref:Uncharacterized protein n=1 Tax=Amycolatopsis bartoniae TaxID=941986 RepID=A0A8H9IP82_9PSEU|nr:hypothetical protein [Amycolatopsis bartoniae]MBB2939517.1 hypothetical protein [Amycolatopsis bartoniae]GHF38868.1 hypothetical protein GCM10017566_10180 [Amycolatopsis bartoniae]
MTDPVDIEQPVEDVLEQRQDVTAVGPEPGVPTEADPADVADQQRPVPLDEEEREYG